MQKEKHDIEEGKVDFFVGLLKAQISIVAKVSGVRGKYNVASDMFSKATSSLNPEASANTLFGRE